MATSAEINIIADIILKVFDKNPAVFESSLQAIKVNTEKVTIDNQVAELRKQQQAYNEQVEAQIQSLLNMR